MLMLLLLLLLQWAPMMTTWQETVGNELNKQVVVFSVSKWILDNILHYDLTAFLNI